jgi:hypothetical protein
MREVVNKLSQTQNVANKLSHKHSYAYWINKLLIYLSSKHACISYFYIQKENLVKQSSHKLFHQLPWRTYWKNLKKLIDIL